MGQQEVYSLLKRHRKKWLSSKEMVDKLKTSPGSVINSLKKLREGNIVNFKMWKTPGKNNNRKVYVYRFRGRRYLFILCALSRYYARRNSY